MNDFPIRKFTAQPIYAEEKRSKVLVHLDSWSASGEAESLEFAGAAGAQYELGVWNPAQASSLEGARIEGGKLVVNIPASSSNAYPHQKVVIHFAH